MYHEHFYLVSYRVVTSHSVLWSCVYIANNTNRHGEKVVTKTRVTSIHQNEITKLLPQTSTTTVTTPTGNQPPRGLDNNKNYNNNKTPQPPSTPPSSAKPRTTPLTINALNGNNHNHNYQQPQRRRSIRPFSRFPRRFFHVSALTNPRRLSYLTSLSLQEDNILCYYYSRWGVCFVSKGGLLFLNHLCWVFIVRVWIYEQIIIIITKIVDYRLYWISLIPKVWIPSFSAIIPR